MRAIANVVLDKTEEDVLTKMVEAGLFPSKDEAARAAIIKYASDLGMFSPDMLWKKIARYKRRKVTPEQLKKDLKAIKNVSPQSS
jgi:Arc/MetJ-type ribon-helix-helix transcriptional regulator